MNTLLGGLGRRRKHTLGPQWQRLLETPSSCACKRFCLVDGSVVQVVTSSGCQTAEGLAFGWRGGRAGHSRHLALTPSLAARIPKKLGPFTLRIKLRIQVAFLMQKCGTIF